MTQDRDGILKELYDMQHTSTPEDYLELIADREQSIRAELDEITEIRNNLVVKCDELEAKISELEGKLETERLRLAGCGVAALGYFDGCRDEYRSASLNDILSLRKRHDELLGKISSARKGLEEYKAIVDNPNPNIVYPNTNANDTINKAIEILK